MCRTKMKRLVIALLLVCIVAGIPAYYKVSEKLHTKKLIDEERARRDSVIQIEVAKFAAVLYRNQCKADSLIAEINESRILDGLPEFNVKIQGEITEPGIPIHDPYIGTVMYGACCFDSSYKLGGEGVLFHLNNPEKLHRLRFFKNDERFYKAYSRQDFSTYKMWMRREILPSEFEGVMSR